MVTMTSADNALKTYYLGVVAEQLNTAVNPLLARFEQTTRDVWGKEIRKLATYGINGGIGAGSEVGDLPTPGGNNYAQFVLTLKNLYGTIEISDKAIRASAHNSGAFLSLLEAEMEGLIKAAKFNFGRMLYGDGSGVLCTTTSQSGNSIVVNNVKNITEGMIVDIIDPSTGDILFAGRKLLEVGRDNKIVYLGGDTISTGSIPTGSILTVQNSYNMEITGIGAIFGDSTRLYGLQRSDNPWLKPYTKTATTVNDIALQNCVDHLEDTVGSTANFIVCSSGVKRNYQDYMSTNRSNIDIMNLTGGCKALSFGGIPLISDRFVPQGTLYVLNTDDFHIHQLCDWRWLEDDNGRVLKQVAGKPVYTATLVKYADLICDRPIGQARITGVTEK